MASRIHRFPILGAAAWYAAQLPSAGAAEATHVEGRSEYRAPRATMVPSINGVAGDAHRDPLHRYRDDDCLEVFVDQDFSGGDHQYNHAAFACQVSLDNRAIDIGTDRRPRELSHHVESRWKQSAGKVTWVLAISIYTDEYEDDGPAVEPVVLTPGKLLGPRDRGWIDAGLFGALMLAN